MQEFLRRYIDSVEQLEILLLIRASGRSWTAGEMTRELSTSIESATSRLESLSRSGLLAVTDAESAQSYSYHPADDRVRRSVDEVADLYPRRRVAVIAFIFSAPDETLRDFSDAFRLRRRGQ